MYLQNLYVLSMYIDNYNEKYIPDKSAHFQKKKK